MTNAGQSAGRTAIVVAINVTVALLHFVTGPQYAGPCPAFVNGYMIDVLLPFAAYFLLVLQERTFGWLRLWSVKAAIVFAVGAAVEIAQLLGVPLLGRTYDPLDFVMYGVGVLLAAAVDTHVLPRLWPAWTRSIDGGP